VIFYLISLNNHLLEENFQDCQYIARASKNPESDTCRRGSAEVPNSLGSLETIALASDIGHRYSFR